MIYDCPFCSIIAGHERSRRVMENDRAVAFLDINPAADGHTLVAPKEHFPDIWALSDEAATDVWRLAVGTAHRLNEVLDPDGMTLFQANRAAGWQDVFHFLLHIVPRWEGDGLVSPWRSTRGDSKRLDDIEGRLQHG